MKIYKRHILFCLFFIVASAGIMQYLYHDSNRTALNAKKSGFTRKVFGNAVSLITEKEADSSFKTLVGAYNNGFAFLGSASRNLLLSDRDMNPIRSEVLPTPSIVKSKNILLSELFNNFVFQYIPNGSRILRTEINSGLQNEIFIPYHFTRCRRLNDSVFVLRAYDKSKMNQEFVLYNIINGFAKTEHKISNKLMDGGLSEDGEILVSPDNRIFYVEYMTNRLLCLDSGLNLLFESRTIDTNTVCKTRVSSTPTGKHNTFAFTGPVKPVNMGGSINNNYLFVHSILRADNERAIDFNNNSVIDVYDSKNGTYQFSFYLPNRDGEKMIGFRVLGNTVVVNYKRHVSVYQLNVFI